MKLTRIQRFRRAAKYTTLSATAFTSGLYVCNSKNQLGADMRGVARGLTNSLIATPLVAGCAYDYINSLKGIEYPSEEYLEKRKGCHERSAIKVLKIA